MAPAVAIPYGITVALVSYSLLEWPLQRMTVLCEGEGSLSWPVWPSFSWLHSQVIPNTSILLQEDAKQQHEQERDSCKHCAPATPLQKLLPSFYSPFTLSIQLSNTNQLH